MRVLDGNQCLVRIFLGESDQYHHMPLARALHASVEIDDEIPVEHYHAVAEVIGYVMKLKRSLRRN